MKKTKKTQQHYFSTGVYTRTIIPSTLEKTEGAFKNGHSTDTGNIGHNTQKGRKKKTTEKRKKEENSDIRSFINSSILITAPKYYLFRRFFLSMKTTSS